MRLPCLSPFPLDPAHALPVTGEFHPLRREFQRWMSWANALTMLLVVAGACAYLTLNREKTVPNAPPKKFVRAFPVPPRIFEHSPQHVFTTPQTPPKLGRVNPVEDVNPEVSTFPTQEDFENVVGPIDPKALQEGEVVVADAPSPLPGPGEYVFCEQLPSLLRMETPVYPSLAREAGVEGMILLRVLVSKEGKVLNVIVLSGNPMLADAARTAAFTAQFSPALQQHKPVPVWVQLPVVFSLK